MTLRFLSAVVAGGLIFAAPSSFARERAPAAGLGYAQCRGAMPIMGMMTMMGPSLYGQHTEGCLTFMKTDLAITASQAPQWNEFVRSVRGNVGAMTEMYESMMLLDDPSTTLSERLALEEKTMTSHLASLKRVEHSVGDLYTLLSEKQKTAAKRFHWFNEYFRETSE